MLYSGGKGGITMNSIGNYLENLPLETIPWLGKLFQRMKNNQFNKRINKIEADFLEVLKLIPEKDYEYFGEKIGIITLQNIFMDEEEDKAEYFILGFENCVRCEYKNEDKAIALFDIVSELRMMDIKRLVFLYDYSKDKVSNNQPSEDMKPYIRFVDEKLERLGLINKEIVEGLELDTDLDKVVIRKVTEDVIEFIGHEN